MIHIGSELTNSSFWLVAISFLHSCCHKLQQIYRFSTTQITGLQLFEFISHFLGFNFLLLQSIKNFWYSHLFVIFPPTVFLRSLAREAIMICFIAAASLLQLPCINQTVLHFVFPLPPSLHLTFLSNNFILSTLNSEKFSRWFIHWLTRVTLQLASSSCLILVPGH